MPKYKIYATYYTESEFEFDTDNYDEFAKTKDELVDKLDPNDPDAIQEFIQNYEPADFGLECSFSDIIVKPKA